MHVCMGMYGVGPHRLGASDDSGCVCVCVCVCGCVCVSTIVYRRSYLLPMLRSTTSSTCSLGVS